MKYDDFARDFVIGDVLLFEGCAWYSRFIKLWTLSKFSHAAITLRIKADGAMIPCVIEAMEPGGIRVFPMALYMRQRAKAGEAVHWYRITDSNVDRDKLVRYALEQWGKRYASLWQMVFSFNPSKLIRWIMRKFGHATPVNLDADRFFCSELVASALRFAGYVPDKDDPGDPVTTDPGQISNYPCLQRVGIVRFQSASEVRQ